jgi:endonuclease/exonuclease/phosphatase family metal-dependent hydrolase
MPDRRQFLHALATSSLLATGISAQAQAPASTGSGTADELAVMTYNLRFASDRPPNAWPDRRPVMRTLLQQYRPDLIGTQEGVFSQLKQVSEDLPGYDTVGLGRDGGSRGEFMMIFYKRDRLELLEYDHFWLSDTPDVMASSTWGNTNKRMVTWARFLDRKTRREFYFWNTHLDHALQPAREKAAALILERIAKQTNPALPLLLVGDFNAVAGDNPVYDLLTQKGGLRDTWFLAETRKNEKSNSFNGFKELEEDDQRIDWILARGELRVRASEIITFRQNGQWPSDHFPVMAWLAWTGSR